MGVYKINALFSEDELKYINNIINTSENVSFYDHLGREEKHIEISDSIKNKLIELVSSISDKKITFDGAMYVKYSNEHGSPNLPPHFDGASADMMIDFQLESNTRWDLGVDVKNYELKDNSGLMFNPNTNIHWRPRKEFKDGEFIKMIFFRFGDPINPSDYSHMRLSQDDPIFDNAKKFRDSL
jgi:hypothetical protein